jgi:hypothetical protein
MTRRKSLADRAMAAWWKYNFSAWHQRANLHHEFMLLANQWRRQAEKQKKGKVKRGK